MGQTKLVVRIAGVVSIASGALCLPVGYGINPKRDLSVFSNLADTSIFVTLGLVLLAVGMLLFLGSWLLPGREPEDLA